MQRFAFERNVVTIVAAAAIVAGCASRNTSAALPPLGADAGSSHHQTFDYTGQPQTFTVPVSVNAIKVVAMGASGSGSSGGYGTESSGGVGGLLKATIPVTPGETLAIYVGGKGGKGGTSGGFNGGASGGMTSGSGGHGGGGGGASDVREGGSGLRDRVLVAGGGGGGGGPSIFYGTGNGGLGGGLVGGLGGGRCYANGPDGCPGTGGTQTQGGAGGNGGDRYGYQRGYSGHHGRLGRGGRGGTGTYTGGTGGGAGGGYYGGGGGGTGSRSTSGVGGGGGGAGGSSFAEKSATHVKNLQGAAPSGNGQIVISWSSSKKESQPQLYFRRSSCSHHRQTGRT